MYMKQIYKPCEPYGWNEVDLIFNSEVPEGWTDVTPPQPCWKPIFYFDTNQWVETDPNGSQENENVE